MFNQVYKGKRVLVTGHTGFKGSWLCLWLQKLGAQVLGLSSSIPTNPAHFEIMGLDSAIETKFIDVRDQESLKKAVKDFSPEIVFHLAAEAIVRTCYDNPSLAFETNVMGTVYLLDVLRDCPSTKVAVFITSDKCYENVEWSYGYRETDRLGGKDPYSASKAAAEVAFSSLYRSYFAQTDKRICTVRAGNVIGGGDWARDRIVPDCVRNWAENRAVPIRSPEATRPWQHVLEPLSGYLWLGAVLWSNKGKELSGNSYNFGPPAEANFSVKELIEEMTKTWKGVQYQVDSTQIGNKKEAGLLKLCCDKALSDLSWRPVLNFAQTVELTASWYKRFYENKDMKSFGPEQIDRYVNQAKELGLVWAQG